MEKLITYETPNLTVYEIHSQRALCQSYGEQGKAGADGSYYYYEEYDF